MQCFVLYKCYGNFRQGITHTKLRVQIQVSEASFKRRILHAPNAIQTIDN